MKKIIVSLLCGVIFGFGLSLSQMIDPDKVQGFLDLFGNWDPTLAWVMGGALMVTIPAFWWLLSSEEKAQIKQGKVDKPLIIGSALFGIGWGLSGYCPGPAIAVTPFIAGELLWFILPLLVGMVLAKALSKN